jgi:hypothetical protein
MTEVQDRIVAELQAAAEKRHNGPLRIDSNESGVTVRTDASASADVLEEYIWNSAGSMLIRVCYLVWEHITGEDHEWGRFSTQREAEQRIAALFSSASLGSGEYYIARLFTNKPLE